VAFTKIKVYHDLLLLMFLLTITFLSAMPTFEQKQLWYTEHGGQSSDHSV